LNALDELGRATENNSSTHQPLVKILFLMRLCDFSPLKLTSGTYGRQLEAKLFGGGRQASDALLAVAVFVCICAFVDVGLAPSQQPVNQSSQLPSGGEYGNVAAEPLR
jgi:hypothetical protein